MFCFAYVEALHLYGNTGDPTNCCDFCKCQASSPRDAQSAQLQDLAYVTNDLAAQTPLGGVSGRTERARSVGYLPPQQGRVSPEQEQMFPSAAAAQMAGQRYYTIPGAGYDQLVVAHQGMTLKKSSYVLPRPTLKQNFLWGF